MRHVPQLQVHERVRDVCEARVTPVRLQPAHMKGGRCRLRTLVHSHCVLYFETCDGNMYAAAVRALQLTLRNQHLVHRLA